MYGFDGFEAKATLESTAISAIVPSNFSFIKCFVYIKTLPLSLLFGKSTLWFFRRADPKSELVAFGPERIRPASHPNLDMNQSISCASARRNPRLCFFSPMPESTGWLEL